ncbi:hypothetical protein [Stenotrophomonas sp. GZD-301]|uniref:hypothetical protein n=1 Tax=Stenotrophomonas sp. GZD-301 TaxID=3404814 RepID=UPI003BB70ABC
MLKDDSTSDIVEAGSNNVQFLLLMLFSVRAKDSTSHRKTLRDPKFIIMIQASTAVGIRPGFREWEAVKRQPVMRIEAGSSQASWQPP